MMLAVVVLATWSVASVASAMPVSTTGNETNTPIPGLNAGINSSYIDSSEERVEPQMIHDIMLKNVRESLLPNYILGSRLNTISRGIEALNRAFTGVFLATPLHNILEGGHFIKWAKSVRQLYYDIPEEEVYKAIFNMLVQLYNGNHRTLAEGLAKMSQNTDAEEIAEILLGIQYKVWADNGKDATNVFEDLQLNEIEGSLLDNPLYEAWSGFVMSRCNNEEEEDKALEVMFEIMKDNFKGDTLISALVQGTKWHATEDRAIKYLDHVFIREWPTLMLKDEIKMFELLELNMAENTDELTANPLFSKWVMFVIEKHKTNPIMAILSIHYTMVEKKYHF